MRKLGPSLPTPQTAEPKVEFVQDWTDLLEAVHTLHEAGIGGDFRESSCQSMEVLETVIEYVPKLIEAYTELWGLTSGLMAAWEQLQVSKDSLYVPDASDMMKGL